MSIEESIQQIETLIEAWQLYEADLNQTDINAMQVLLKENQKQKEVIDKIINLIKKYGKYDGKKCTRGFQMWSADFNKILDILKEVSE